MALTTFPGSVPVRRGPPPLPIRLRMESVPFSSLSRDLVTDLYTRLTNDGARGDLQDSGDAGGSMLAHLIDEARQGRESTKSWWVVTCWPESRFTGPVAWAMLREEARGYDRVFRIGIYVAPAWRRRGIATMLADESLRLAHRLGLDRLVAAPWNAGSARFFRNAGFETLFYYTPDAGGLAELDVPTVLPPRRQWRCAPPEAT